MKRAWWLGLVLLVGCTVAELSELEQDKEYACDSANPCVTGYFCVAGVCRREQGPVTPPPVEPDKCQPGCTATQTCTVDGCRASFTALTLDAPSAGTVLTGGPVTVRARLTRQYDVAAYPSTLSLSVMPVGGTETLLAPVTANGDGTYSAEWTPPAGEADYDVKAAYAEAGLTAPSVRVRVDTVGPTFTVELPAFNTPNPAGGFTFAQPQAPEAFRRDQTVLLRVQSTATDVDLTTFKVNVRGVNGGPDLTNLTLTDCAGVAFCKQANVNLWEPGLNAFSGSFAVEVEGKDLAGNAGVRAGATSIPVTRWRWAFEGTSGNIRSSPAIGETGTVYFGTSDVSRGKVFALNPSGAKKWTTDLSLGAVTGSVAVGRPRASNEEYVFLGATSGSATQFYALRGSDGGQHAKCPGNVSGFGSALFEGSFAVDSTTGVSPYETAATVYNSSSAGRIVVLRPDEALEVDRCSSYTNTSGANFTPFTTAGASVVRSGEDIFFGTSTAQLTSYRIGNNTVSGGWPVGTSFVVHGLALFGGNLYGGTGDRLDNGGLFTLPQAGGTVSYLYPGTPNSRVFNLTVGAGNIAFFSAETSTGGNLVRLDLATPATNTRVVGAGGRSAPVVGRNGALYTVTDDGNVTAWTASTLTSRWTVALEVGSPDASPTLDCLREGGSTVPANTLGVLYVPAGSRLHAIIVDSPGLDATAPWPKYQHDARNSGNPVTPITSCQ